MAYKFGDRVKIKYPVKDIDTGFKQHEQQRIEIGYVVRDDDETVIVVVDDLYCPGNDDGIRTVPFEYIKEL